MGTRAPQPQGGVSAGDWDRVLDRDAMWGARYEGAKGAPTGFVPLERYGFFTSAQAHFSDGAPWETTPWHRWMTEHGPSRYNTPTKIAARQQLLDALFAACRDGTYRLNVPDEDLPLINIGRAGRIALEDGRHRICVAKVAGLPKIRVRVNAVHPGAIFIPEA